MKTNENFTLESKELNEGKKVAFIAGGVNRDIDKSNLKAKMKSIVEYRKLKLERGWKTQQKSVVF